MRSESESQTGNSGSEDNTQTAMNNDQPGKSDNSSDRSTPTKEVPVNIMVLRNPYNNLLL